MKFHLVDRIEALEPPERIVTTKCLTAAEEYLADHFPTFPVMPGVLMLEACVQAAAWLVRLATGFGVSMVVLQRARNVRYASFVAPGHTLRIEATAGKSADGVHATDASLAGADADILAEMKQRFERIRPTAFPSTC